MSTRSQGERSSWYPGGICRSHRYAAVTFRIRATICPQWIRGLVREPWSFQVSCQGHGIASFCDRTRHARGSEQSACPHLPSPRPEAVLQALFGIAMDKRRGHVLLRDATVVMESSCGSRRTHNTPPAPSAPRSAPRWPWRRRGSPQPGHGYRREAPGSGTGCAGRSASSRSRRG